MSGAQCLYTQGPGPRPCLTNTQLLSVSPIGSGPKDLPAWVGPRLTSVLGASRSLTPSTLESSAAMRTACGPWLATCAMPSGSRALVSTRGTRDASPLHSLNKLDGRHLLTTATRRACEDQVGATPHMAATLLTGFLRPLPFGESPWRLHPHARPLRLNLQLPGVESNAPCTRDVSANGSYGFMQLLSISWVQAHVHHNRRGVPSETVFG